MEVALVLLEGRLVLGGVQVQESLGVGGGQVKALQVDVSLGRRREHLKDPESASSSGPSVAEDGLIIAVDISNVGSVGESSELGGSLIEGSLHLQAVPCCSIALANMNYYFDAEQ